ncbi:hypothetical protein ACQ4PT_036832 [Festuca glaucescens]
MVAAEPPGVETVAAEPPGADHQTLGTERRDDHDGAPTPSPPRLLSCPNLLAPDGSHQISALLGPSNGHGAANPGWRTSWFIGLAGGPPGLQGKLRENEARMYFKQLIDAIDYFHIKGVYHRGLKPENLLDSRGNLEVSDFGLSTLSQNRVGLLHTTCGTLKYISPEDIEDLYQDSA